jgi:hypothetical protein
MQLWRGYGGDLPSRLFDLRAEPRKMFPIKVRPDGQSDFGRAENHVVEAEQGYPFGLAISHHIELVAFEGPAHKWSAANTTIPILAFYRAKKLRHKGPNVGTPVNNKIY